MKCLFVKQRQGLKALTYLKGEESHHLLQLLQAFQLLEQKSRTPLVEEMAKDEDNQ